jgi:hypothetical protein
MVVGRVKALKLFSAHERGLVARSDLTRGSAYHGGVDASTNCSQFLNRRMPPNQSRMYWCRVRWHHRGHPVSRIVLFATIRILRFFAHLLSSVSFTQKIPNLDLTIYEKEDGIGGTWYVNRYPVSER